ncbi:MAG: response regulator [bacterium]|nr:response regulator [bacterium]
MPIETRHAPARESPGGSAISVLVIEDDLVFQRIIQDYLRHPSVGGIRVTLADRLKAGLDQLDPETVDAVLLDLTLPDSEGLDTLRRIEEYAPWVPVIVLTGLDDDAVAAEAVRRGAQDFIVKTDLNPALLARSIRYAIERSKAEAALRDSESRFRAVVEDQTELVCRFLPNGRLTFVNRAFCRFFGRDPEHLLGRSFLPVTGDDQAPTATFFASADPRQPTRSREQHLVPPVGDPSWIQWTDRALFDGEGRLVEFQSVGRDITEQKKLERQLFQAQKMENLGQLAGGLAHDFNNLLTVITGCCGLLLLEEEQAGIPPNPRIFEIEKAAHRAASLTQQLLAVSRRHVARPVVLDLNQVVWHTEEMLRRLLGERVEVSVSPEPGLGRVKADRSQIEQILVNLVVNARDAMPEGGKLTIATAAVTAEEPHPGESPTHRGPWAELAVTDTGVGMGPDLRERIFEPFFTTKAVGRGTGLGLSIVYSLVKQSDGLILVESEPDRGTTIRIRFPITGEPQPSFEEPLADRAARPLRGSGTILLVEDESTVRAMVQSLLEPQGYTVLPAGSAEEAMEVLADAGHDLDAMLTDIVLPGQSGLQLADEVKARFPGIRILYMSGYADTATDHEGWVASERNFLQKPFSPNELLIKLSEVLSHAGKEGEEP